MSLNHLHNRKSSFKISISSLSIPTIPPTVHTITMPTKSLLRSIFRNKQKFTKEPRSPSMPTPTPTPNTTTISSASSTYISLSDVLVSRTLTAQPSTSSLLSTTSTISTGSTSHETSPLAHKHRPKSRAKSRASTTTLLDPIFEERSQAHTQLSIDTQDDTELHLTTKPTKCSTRKATQFEHSSSSPYQTPVPSPSKHCSPPIKTPHTPYTPANTSSHPALPNIPYTSANISTLDFHNTPEISHDPQPPSFPSQTHILPAALAEAALATHAHLDTLSTVLQLLDALNGFSATIDVLREEMQEKVGTCEERLDMIGDVERMVGGE